jgi:hypothetical protein
MMSIKHSPFTLIKMYLNYFVQYHFKTSKMSISIVLCVGASLRACVCARVCVYVWCLLFFFFFFKRVFMRATKTTMLGIKIMLRTKALDVRSYFINEGMSCRLCGIAQSVVFSMRGLYLVGKRSCFYCHERLSLYADKFEIWLNCIRASSLFQTCKLKRTAHF